MKPAQANRPPGQVRIIAGRWRGSRLVVPALPGLRPSSDRVRETLFNWLQHQTASARVLDLYAGSGALGIEAASRGAASVDLVERDPRAAKVLQAAIARLDPQAEVLRLHPGDAMNWLAATPGPWDLVFLDPPFDPGLPPGLLDLLAPRLAGPAWVYLESPRDAAPPVPAQWSRHRVLHTREVEAALYRVGGS